MWSQTILLSSMLLLTTLHVSATVSGQECLESYFVIDLDIEPRNLEVNASWCDGKDSIRLQRLVEYSVKRKFDVYLRKISQLDRAQVNELCGGFRSGATVRRRGRNLQTLSLGPAMAGATVRRQSAGFVYLRIIISHSHPLVFTEHDANVETVSELNFGFVNGTLVQLSVPPSGAPSAPPTNAPSVGPAPERGSTPAQARLERLLKQRLEKQLRRVLRKKINRNHNSCLRGSQPRVGVTLTPVGTSPPPQSLVCPTE